MKIRRTEELDGVKGEASGGLGVVENDTGAVLGRNLAAVAREGRTILEGTTSLK